MDNFNGLLCQEEIHPGWSARAMKDGRFHLSSDRWRISLAEEDVKQLLDAFQQTLLAIGEDVYRRASQSSVDEPTYTPDHPATQVAPTTQPGLDDDDDDYSLENDATVTADYEAVD